MRPRGIYNIHPYKVVETLSGRTALEHIVEILVWKGLTTAYLPSYCCHTMIEPFLAHGMVVKFYDVTCTSKGLHRILDENEVYDTLLLMDYFGHVDDETIEIALQAKKNGKTIIYDATHAIYSEVDYWSYDFIYGSYRKWVNINYGFMAWNEELKCGEITQNSDTSLYVSVRKKLFDYKAEYMRGEGIRKEDFLPLISEAESILEEEYHHKMPDVCSKEVLRTTDAEFLKNRRRDNARTLTNAIIGMDDCRVCCVNPLLSNYGTALFVPVLINPSHRDALRRHLISREIYCPVHWPLTEQHVVMTGSGVLFNSELSLICDQRYDSNDMMRIAESIREYLNKN